MRDSRITREHRQSNREKLQQAHELILSVSHDEQIGPTAFEYLTKALDALEEASRFSLNEAEMFEPYDVKCHECRHTIRWTDSVRESAEGGLCKTCRPTLPAWVAEQIDAAPTLDPGPDVNGLYHDRRDYGPRGGID